MDWIAFAVPLAAGLLALEAVRRAHGGRALRCTVGIHARAPWSCPRCGAVTATLPPLRRKEHP